MQAAMRDCEWIGLDVYFLYSFFGLLSRRGWTALLQLLAVCCFVFESPFVSVSRCALEAQGRIYDLETAEWFREESGA